MFAIFSKLILFVAIMVAGQILFKKAANASLGCEGVVCQFTSHWFLLAIALYALSTMLWVVILQSVPLSVAYPFTAMAFVVVPVVAHFIWDEAYDWKNVLGGVLIVTGIGFSISNMHE